MNILNNFRYNIVDVAISDATNVVQGIIQRLQIIQGYQAIENDVFIELCNEMQHIELNFVNNGWTIGQKRAFLKTLEPLIQEIQDKFNIFFYRSFDISSANEEQLDIAIELLKTNLLEYIKKCEHESAEKHAALMGEKVAEELKKINQDLLTSTESSPEAKQEAISTIFANLATYTLLHESWQHKTQTISVFLDRFQQHYDQKQLISLLRASSVNSKGYKHNYSVLRQAVFEAARNKIEDIFVGLIDKCGLDEKERRTQIDDEHLQSFLLMYRTEATDKESFRRKDLEKEMQTAFDLLKSDLDRNIEGLRQSEESIFYETKAAYRAYKEQIEQYSGSIEESASLNSKKEQVEQLVQRLSSKKIQEIAEEFSIKEEHFKDHPTAIKYLADLEQNCLHNNEKVKNQAINLHVSMQQALQFDKNIKEAIEHGDINVFSEGMRALTNDIPHAIQKIIIPETNKHITLGSSRFF